jgi:uncharacterized Zn finger protein (UPF0148 family)
MSKGEHEVGDYCSVANCTERLISVNGAVVCPNCDAVNEWPSVKRGEAEIVRA